MGQAAPELDELSYEDILAAVQETARGRWFLAEHDRRNRSADTHSILDELRRMQSAAEDARLEVLRAELTELSQTIVNTRDEISKIQPKTADGASNERIEAATGELDAIVSATEQATSDILSAAEQIQEIAEKMREAGVDTEFCDPLDTESLNILMACSFQDITGQRTSKVVNTLRYLEQRVNAMVDIWGAAKPGALGLKGLSSAERDIYNPNDTRPDAHLLHGPASDGSGIAQDDIDAMMDSEIELETKTVDLPDLGDIMIVESRPVSRPAEPDTPDEAPEAASVEEAAPGEPDIVADAEATEIGQDEIDSLFE